uniref:Protein transport protein sec16 n=1 Tax=Esox lucius TaxID=8010 RepID=A0A6Q2Z9N8_ESOLU
MQPPPRPGPPGVSRPPQASGGPNAFRRQRPHKNTGSMAGQPPPAQPMTDPFAFGRQNAPILAAPSSSPQPIQNMAPSTYPQAGMSQGLHQSQPLEDAQAGAAPLDPQLSSTPGVSLFTPHSGMSPFPGALLCPPDHASPSAEQGYFNSSVPVPSMTPRPPPMASAPVPGQAPHAPDHRGEPPPRVMPFPPVFAASSQWGHDHGSRPPSVQNYFQPTSDPLPMTYHTPAQIPSPHGAPPVQQTLPSPQQPDKAPSSQWSNLANANGLQQHDSHFQNQSYLSQSSASQESRLNQPPQDLAYHQMGAGPSLTRPDSAGSHYRPDSAGSHHGSAPAPVPYVADGTISMFFEGSDVENEETLAGEGGRTVNGLQPSHSHEQMSSHNPQAHLLAGVEAPQGYQAPPLEADQPPPYMFDNNFPGAEDTAQPKPTEGQFDHVENLECVTNQEVLPSEPQSSPVAAAAHGGVRYEVGPNLETPDCVSRYSNMSHSSGTGIVPRRHQGVVGTFIQQESPRPSEDVHLAAASGGYFEQIDTSPAGDAAAARHRVSERVYPSQPPTPSPPKPTGVFQASANSSFEPVRSHTVGVRPVEVDRARMVVERGSDSLPGNLEQPPDNVENIYGAAVGHAQAGVGVPPLGYPLSQSLSRPSSRAHVAHRPCESPATTLWAQQDPASLGANILLAPAAPPVLAPLREPSAEVIQPPEDNPLDLQAPHHGSLPSPHPTENLENPPKVSEGDFSDPQTALGYASLLVSESLHQPVLIAPPISNYSVIPPSNSALSANQISPREASLPVRTPASQPSPRPSSHQNPLFPPTQMSFSSTSSQIYFFPQDDPYRRLDPRYGRYDGANPAYPPYREPQPERPSSRTSQYSDRPSSRSGQSNNCNSNTLLPMRTVEKCARVHLSGIRPQGYDDQWRYYPGYDASFDDDYRRQRDLYGDDFDRRSVHSEQSAHSLHSSHSHHSRHSSFSSRSQQSQVYRSQPDLTAVYDPTVSTLPVDYSYGQYPEQTDLGQSFSQYPYTSGYQADDSTWVATEQPPPRPVTPEKFSVPHRCACFGPGGHLIQVLPNLPSAGQPALVEIHNMETMLQDTSEQSELRSFPGPLLKDDTHKVDVIKFSQNKVLECARNNDLLDKDSAALLWDFIVLLCRQNGTVVGTDLADLLLKEHRSVWLPGKSPNEANLIDFNNEPLARAEEEPGAGPLSLLSDTFMTVPENVGKETERFRELLLFGRKKDALEAAMKGGLWGHALLLASKMDSRTHARVMTRFANSLPINDPLQTVYQLMSGRMPASATCCGDEKWGDWRPHLAMVLSNLTHTLDLDTRTITTMGDTLASKGLIDAAHFCYLMAQVGLGVFTKKSTKMVLIGSNHSLSFYQFATNEAIQRTEAYEYAQSLGSQPCSLPNFQVFKLIYACRLAEAGLCAQAFHYCEVISRSVLIQPSYHSPVFISQLIQMSEKMRFFDPQLKEKADQELFMEPEWLIHLRQLDGQMRVGVCNLSCLCSCVMNNSQIVEDFFLLSIVLSTDGLSTRNACFCHVLYQGGGGGGGSGGWLNWLYRKGKNEAHLPDDKNKSIVWDEKKQKWVNLDEPEEEYKPPPPPPSGFPKMPGPKAGPGGPPTGGPPVNMFSRRAGTKSRYVDVLNPGGTRAKPCGSAPAPSDFFAPLAPMPMPTNLFVPGAGIPSVCWRMCTCVCVNASDQQPMEGNVPQTEGNQEQSGPNPSSVSQVPYYIPSILDYN